MGHHTDCASNALQAFNNEFGDSKERIVIAKRQSKEGIPGE